MRLEESTKKFNRSLHIMWVGDEHLEAAVFSLDYMSDEECDRIFRFTRAQIFSLVEELQIPDELRTRNSHVVDGVTALCMLLARLSSGKKMNFQLFILMWRQYTRPPQAHIHRQTRVTD